MKLYEHFFYCDLYLPREGDCEYSTLKFGENFCLTSGFESGSTKYYEGSHLIEAIRDRDYLQNVLSRLNKCVEIMTDIIESEGPSTPFKDKGATELIPLREFRNELLRMRENSQYRDSKRRNGSVYKKSDGSFGMGPFTLEARCLILEKLLDLENRTGMELITEAELKAIDKMWDEEGDLTCRALVETYHKVKGKKLPWDDYKTPRFDDEAIQAIRDVADKYDIPVELITKLIVSVDTNKHITKNNKMQKAFDSIIGQGWLHYNSVEGALNHED